MSTTIPIIQSNAPVESFWSRLKTGFIKPLGKRPKLETLVHIIMDQHLDDLTFQVNAHRNLEQPVKPRWYSTRHDQPD
jgi:hypothetical protein